MPGPAKPLALTMGEPAGIGPEITLRAWLERDILEVPCFVYLGSVEHLRGVARRFEMDVPIATVTTPAEAVSRFQAALPVIPQTQSGAIELGKPTAGTAKAVIDAIRQAVSLVKQGSIKGLVTNPIHKHTLIEAGFSYPGHTEFLGHLDGNGGETTTVMMLANAALKTVPVTVHSALSEVTDQLSEQKIVHAGTITAAALTRYFGISKPRLAVAGLNPHAGEGGQFGNEETEIIAPAVAALNRAGITTTGPLAADSLFHLEARKTYDAALCMYHDQALIPVKTLGFHTSVNVTLGLTFIRTSPDHGTGLDIASKGVARSDSLVEALKLALSMSSKDTASKHAEP